MDKIICHISGYFSDYKPFAFNTVVLGCALCVYLQKSGLKRLIIPNLSSEHLSKWRTTLCLCLKYLPHLPQENCCKLECTSWWDFDAAAAQKRLGHSLQTYDLTCLCWSKCFLRSSLRMNFFWQMSHMNQVPSLCDFSRCVLSWLYHLKWSEQCLHEYGFASVWIMLCLTRSADRVNRLWQTVHSNGFSPLWILLCWTRFPFCVNCVWQTLHSNGFCPLWILMCWVRWCDCLNCLWQTLHSNGFSPLWILLCSTTLAFCVNCLWQTLHSNGFSPLWILMCWARWCGCLNCLWQTLHSNGFCPVWLRLCNASI